MSNLAEGFERGSSSEFHQSYVAGEKILVTQPFLPPLEEAQELLADIPGFHFYMPPLG